MGEIRLLERGFVPEETKVIIGYAYVVADILHVGHLRHLMNCKAMCDVLIVGILTDKATMEKKSKPIISFEERILIVDAFECVDVVFAQDTYSPLNNVHCVKPDILFESESHENKCINPYGKVIVMPYYPLQTTTAIKNKIVEEHGN